MLLWHLLRLHRFQLWMYTCKTAICTDNPRQGNTTVVPCNFWLLADTLLPALGADFQVRRAPSYEFCVWEGDSEGFGSFTCCRAASYSRGGWAGVICVVTFLVVLKELLFELGNHWGAVVGVVQCGTKPSSVSSPSRLWEHILLSFSASF